MPEHNYYKGAQRAAKLSEDLIKKYKLPKPGITVKAVNRNIDPIPLLAVGSALYATEELKKGKTPMERKVNRMIKKSGGRT